MISARLLPLLTSVLSGCLYAPPLEERAEENTPPVIREVSPDPTQEEHVVVAPAEPLVFRIAAIDDQNVEDTLHARWFVDADEIPQPKFFHVQRATGEVRRATAWEYQVVPCAVTLSTDRSFYVETVVSDREFDPSDDPFRGVPDDALTVHLGWRVRIDEAAIGECEE